MQRYAISKADGSVAVMMLVPNAFTVEGLRFTATRIVDGMLLGSTKEMVVTPPGAVRTLIAKVPLDSPEVSYEYPPVADEIAKWPEAEQAQVNYVMQLTEAPPADRTFRNAWVLDGDKIGHDMGKAREIHRERMRAARAPKLAALDVDYQRADEGGKGEDKARIAAKKQALRDVTKDPAIDAATTPEQLKAVWPAVLEA